MRPQGLFGRQRMRVTNGCRTTVALVARRGAALVLPLFAGSYVLSVLVVFLHAAYLGQCWNIMMGFAGQFSLGHALYVGLGAYAARGALCSFRPAAVGRG